MNEFLSHPVFRPERPSFNTTDAVLNETHQMTGGVITAFCAILIMTTSTIILASFDHVLREFLHAADENGYDRDDDDVDKAARFSDACTLLKVMSYTVLHEENLDRFESREPVVLITKVYSSAVPLVFLIDSTLVRRFKLPAKWPDIRLLISHCIVAAFWFWYYIGKHWILRNFF